MKEQNKLADTEQKAEGQLVTAKVFSIKVKQSKCFHKSVELDLETRHVNCNHCGAMIDAFDFLYSCAVEETMALATIQSLRKEKAQLQTEVEKLKKQKVFLKTITLYNEQKNS